MKTQVAIVPCRDYERDTVHEAVKRGVDLIGGIGRFVRPGEEVLLKPNLVMKKRPEEAATTHPAVVQAVARLVQSAGGLVTIGDSPGGPYTGWMLDQVYRATGMTEVAERTGALLNRDLGEVTAEHPEARIARSLTLTAAAAKAGAIISLPKLKTHGQALFTGAVKNLFGTVPGMKKAEYHFKMTDPESFSDMLVDIARFLKPRLSVMDAVVGMEGAGPTAGTPSHIGLILVSASPFALDVAACTLVGIDPLEVPTIAAAHRRGIQEGSLEGIEVLGAKIADYRLRDFVRPSIRELNYAEFAPRFLRPYLNRSLRPKPVFVHSGCTGCRTCHDCCPPRAIRMVDRRPVVDLDQCIRCFCCQELCPRKTVRIYRPWLLRALVR